MRLIPAGNPSEWTGPTGNNTWLLDGPPAILIDAGVGNAEHVAAIANALDGAELAVVLLTHGHVDHVAGVPALLERWPGAVVRGGGVGAPLTNGELFTAGATVIEAIHTPGHAPDHFCFHDRQTRDVYCGDLARRGGTVVIPASRGGDLRQYLASLERIRALRPARLLPAHGPIVDDPTGLIDEYLAHRAERSRQIRAALADGCTTAEAIVNRVYPGLPASLHAGAIENVRAHLLAIED